MSDAGTVGIEYEITGVERVSGAGRLAALANVVLTISGIEVTLQGVGVVRDAAGGLTCRAPVFRHPRSGAWLPAVTLPPELSEAIAAEVLAAFRRRG